MKHQEPSHLGKFRPELHLWAGSESKHWQNSCVYLICWFGRHAVFFFSLSISISSTKAYQFIYGLQCLSACFGVCSESRYCENKLNLKKMVSITLIPAVLQHDLLPIFHYCLTPPTSLQMLLDWNNRELGSVQENWDIRRDTMSLQVVDADTWISASFCLSLFWKWLSRNPKPPFKTVLENHEHVCR